MLVALFTVPAGFGYPVLFTLVAPESAGALVPGVGGTLWAATIGSLADVLGRGGSGLLGSVGFVGLGLAGLVYLLAHLRAGALGARRSRPSRRRRSAIRTDRRRMRSREPLSKAPMSRRVDHSTRRAKAAVPPTRRERAVTERAIKRYTGTSWTGSLAISWAKLTEAEARRLVDLTTRGDRSTRHWWPLVLRAAGVRAARPRAVSHRFD
jgi:hypothetical protein